MRNAREILGATRCPSERRLATVSVIVVLFGIATSSCSTPSGPAVAAKWSAEIAPRTEPGERLIVLGIVRDVHGQPLPNARVHVYHADGHGNYADPSRGDGAPRLRGALRSGPRGEFRVLTVVPGTPSSAEPPHMHFEIEARGHDREALAVYMNFSAGESSPPRLDSLSKRDLIRLGDRFGAAGSLGFRAIPATRGRDGVWSVITDLRLAR